MASVELNTPALDVTLPDFKGNRVSLSDFHSRFSVAAVFNRGFL